MKVSGTWSGIRKTQMAFRAGLDLAILRSWSSANAELIRLYWDIDRAIALRQQRRGWSSGVIPRLVRDLRNELPEVKDFSERNIDRMVEFYWEYPGLEPISP